MSEVIQEDENSNTKLSDRKLIKFVAFYEIALATICLYVLSSVLYDFLQNDLPEEVIHIMSIFYPYIVIVSIFSFLGGLFLWKDKKYGKWMSVIAQIVTFFYLKAVVDLNTFDGYYLDGCISIKFTFENLSYIYKRWHSIDGLIALAFFALLILLILFLNRNNIK